MRALRKIILLLILGGAVTYGVVAGLNPWAMHIGGRWTPFLTWHGSGKLHTNTGAEYPLYVSFYPASHFSQLHMDGLRPTGGLQGSAWLCTAPGETQYLTLSGTIYGGWRSTEGSLMDFRLLEQKIIVVGQRRGFFDLYGKWQGQQLVMDARTSVASQFRSGLKIEHPSVTLDWGSYSDFKSVCANSPARH